MSAPQYKYLSLQTWGTDIQATSAVGATFVNLPHIPCDEVTIFNPSTGVALDMLAAGQAANPTKYVILDAPSGTVVPVSGSAKEIMVRRSDQSGTPVTVRFSWRKFRR